MRKSRAKCHRQVSSFFFYIELESRAMAAVGHVMECNEVVVARDEKKNPSIDPPAPGGLILTYFDRLHIKRFIMRVSV